MPEKIFLETFPLYKYYNLKTQYTSLIYFEKCAINMKCLECKSFQTFTMRNDYYRYKIDNDPSPENKVLKLDYKCTHCEKFERFFMINFSANGKRVAKVGQFPSWEINVEKKIEDILGERSEFYKMGLINESQSYGIGAYAYYRRIVEEIIQDLLVSIEKLIPENEKPKYIDALEQTKKTTVTEKKIELVKELLPSNLRPDGLNPLSILHSALSEGLHNLPDSECLRIANEIRETIIYLITQIKEQEYTAKTYSDNMKKILESKNKKKTIE